jgi:hypothetical protein
MTEFYSDLFHYKHILIMSEISIAFIANDNTS